MLKERLYIKNGFANSGVLRELFEVLVEFR